MCQIVAKVVCAGCQIVVNVVCDVCQIVVRFENLIVRFVNLTHPMMCVRLL